MATSFRIFDRGVALVENLTSVVALAAITGLVCVQVFYRYVLLDGIMWGDEVVAQLMVVMVMFGAARGMRKGEHTDMQSLVDALPPRPRKAARLLTWLTTLGFLLVFLVSSWSYAVNAGSLKTVMLKIPLWLSYGVMPVGCLLLIYEFSKRFRIWIFREVPDSEETM